MWVRSLGLEVGALRRRSGCLSGAVLGGWVGVLRWLDIDIHVEKDKCLER